MRRCQLVWEKKNPQDCWGFLWLLWSQCFWLQVNIEETLGPYNTPLQLSGKSLFLCYLIDPQLSRPEEWWCNLLLFTRVACTVINGLVLLPLPEAREKALGYIYDGLNWAESCCSWCRAGLAMCCWVSAVHAEGMPLKTQSNMNQLAFEVHFLFFFQLTTGAGKRSVHIKQPTWGNPDHA